MSRLVVTVEKGQSVVLDNRHTLTVDEICDDGVNFSLRDYSDPSLPKRDTLTTAFEQTGVDEFDLGVKEECELFEDISITVVEQKDSKVKITIEAPRDVPIFRQNIYERIINEEIDNHLAISNHEAIDTYRAVEAACA